MLAAMPWRLAFPVAASFAAAACTNSTVPIDEDDGSTGSPTTTNSDVGEDSTAPTTATDDPTTSPGVTTAVDSTGTNPATSTTTGADTATTTGAPATCGNNVIERDEVCDLTQLNGETCQSLGFMGGELGCLLTCEDYNILGCFICGNDKVEDAEDCEGVPPKEVTCDSLGFEGGNLACGADCLFDTTDCSICGDGIRQGPEDCDGVDLGGETCNSIGFDAGDLGCQRMGCGFDYSGCTGGMYFQDFEAGPPLPLEFTTAGAADWVVDMGNPVNGSFSAWSTDLGEGQNNSMQLTATFAVAGDVSFWHEESSEASFDYLEFYVDGVLNASWSGVNPPAEHSAPVAAGVHTFEWRYTKDGIVSVGADSVWVDDITLVPGVPI